MNRRTMMTLGVCLLGSAMVAAPMAPDVKVTAPGNRAITSSGYKGKVVLVQFLFTDCVHCQHTAEMLSRLQLELGGKGLQVIGAAFNDPAKDAANIQDFVVKHGVTFPVGYAERVEVMKHLELPMMGRFVVPQIMIIGRDGTVRAKSDPMGTPELMDEQQLRVRLMKLLEERPGKK